MEYLEFLLYGLIQGFTEFIPISSTAHLKIISLFLGFDDPGSSLSAIIQLGSVFAIFWYFRRDIFLFRNSSFGKSTLYSFDKTLLKSIFLGTIPILFSGGFIKFFIPEFFETVLRSNLSISIISLIMAALMYFADLNKNRYIDISNHNYSNSLLIGLAQSFAVIPGVSRSGITISVALLSKWKRKDAAKFSFLLGLPAISISAIFELLSSLNGFSTISLLPLIIALISAFLSSLLAMDFLLKFLSSYGLKIFIFYRVIFGLIILFNL